MPPPIYAEAEVPAYSLPALAERDIMIDDLGEYVYGAIPSFDFAQIESLVASGPLAGAEDVTNGIYKAACSMHLQTSVKGGNILGMGSYDWALSTATGAFTSQAGSLNSLISGAGSSGRPADK